MSGPADTTELGYWKEALCSGGESSEPYTEYGDVGARPRPALLLPPRERGNSKGGRLPKEADEEAALLCLANSANFSPRLVDICGDEVKVEPMPADVSADGIETVPSPSGLTSS